MVVADLRARWSREAGVRLSAPWIEDGRRLVARGSRGRGRAGRPRPAGSRTASGSTSSRPASTSARPCTSTEAAPTASIAASPSSRTSTTSACTGSIRGRDPVRDHARGRRTAASLRGRAHHARRPLWIGVRERHAESDRSADVVNELVAIPTDGSSRAARHRRADATSTRIRASRRTARGSASSPGTSRGCRGTAASSTSPTSRPTATSASIEHVAGTDGSESIWQPEWSPTGDLVFASDRSGWWNLERIRDGERSPLHPAEAEFGYPAWAFGARSFAFLGDGRIVCGFDSGGFTHFGVLDPSRASCEELDLGLDSLAGSPYVCAEGLARRDRGGIRRRSRARSRGSTSTTGAIETLRLSVESPVPTGLRLDPAGDRVPDRGRPDRARVLLPADESRVRGAGRRAPAAHRREPRRPDGQRDGGASASACSSGRVAASRSSTSTTAARPATDAPTASG